MGSSYPCNCRACFQPAVVSSWTRAVAEEEFTSMMENWEQALEVSLLHQAPVGDNVPSNIVHWYPIGERRRSFKAMYASEKIQDFIFSRIMEGEPLSESPKARACLFKMFFDDNQLSESLRGSIFEELVNVVVANGTLRGTLLKVDDTGATSYDITNPPRKRRLQDWETEDSVIETNCDEFFKCISEDAAVEMLTANISSKQRFLILPKDYPVFDGIICSSAGVSELLQVTKKKTKEVSLAKCEALLKRYDKATTTTRFVMRIVVPQPVIESGNFRLPRIMYDRKNDKEAEKAAFIRRRMVAQVFVVPVQSLGLVN